MSDGSARGFLFSATLHGIVAALMLFSFIVSRRDRETPKVFELVAGEGDNYMAREAPALGSPGGVAVEIAVPPPPSPPPEAAQPVIAPAPPVQPPTPAPPKKSEPAVPDFKKKLRRDLIVAESKAKLEIKRQREAEARKRAAEEKKQREAEAKRQADDEKKMTKEEFDRANKSKSKSSPAKSVPVKVAKIDAEGIAKGVVGGSTTNKVGGAGGKALKADNDDVLAAYDALFKQRLREKFEPPPGLSDSLKVEIEVRSQADGSLTGARVAKSSGSAEFDQAVLEAVSRVRMPPRPDRKSESIAFIFTMRERLER
ncbi:MAG: cell envelope integrity protein TolA [Opitutaceae bacterium]